MASPANPANRGSSSHSSTPDRPATIAELAAIAHKDAWDPTKPLKHWLRTAEKARKAGQAHVDALNYEAAFIEFARAATIVLEKLPTHSEYQALLNADQRHNLGMNGQDMVEHLTQLKQILVDRYERWHAKRDSDREEGAKRRQEEQLRIQEERARQAREEAQREEEWRRQDLARREAEELERRVREESEWARRSSEARSRESSEARRAAEAREAAEHERMAQAARLRREDEARRQQSDDEREQRARKRLEERNRAEQEGILRRQQEADAAARAARRDVAASTPSATRSSEPEFQRRSQGPGPDDGLTMPVPVVTPQPSRPVGPSRNVPYSDANYPVPSTMPLESPSRLEDDTDGEYDGRSRPQRFARVNDDTPTKAMKNMRISYPPPVTTTSPAPRDLGPIRYPTLMSQHQLKQGYVPSLQSMFSPSSSEPPANSSLLLEARPMGALYNHILPKPSKTPSPVVPPYPSGGMPAPDLNSYPSYDTHYATPRRGPSPASSRPPPPPPPPPVPSSSTAPRITKVASKDPSIRELKSVRLPRACLPRFLSIARINTEKNRETCGLLLGKDRGSKYVITTLLIPKQHSTSDTCTMDEEELVMQFTEERQLITLGWIHTHPTQSCFMSSVDLHTHSGFQQMLPESFAVVCAPHSNPTFGLFRLTDPGGLQTILDCHAKEAFHPHPDVPIYTDCDNNHVIMKDMSLEIVDLR